MNHTLLMHSILVDFFGHVELGSPRGVLGGGTQHGEI